MITSLNFSRFPGDDLYTFANAVSSISKSKTDAVPVLLPYVNNVIARIPAFQDSLTREAKNPFTPMLKAQRILFINSSLALRMYLEACERRKTEGWKGASGILLAVYRHYGWRAMYLGYKAATAATLNIIKDIKEKHSAELAFVLGTDWMTDLEEDVAAYIALYNRSIEEAPDGGPTLLTTRPVLTKALKNLFSIIDLTLDNDPTDALRKLEADLNELIVKSVASLKAAETREENSKTEEGGTSEE